MSVVVIPARCVPGFKLFVCECIRHMAHLGGVRMHTLAV